MRVCLNYFFEIVDIKKKSFISLFETKKKDIHKLKMGMLFSCHGKRPKEDYEKISIVKNSFLSCGGRRKFYSIFPPAYKNDSMIGKKNETLHK